MKLMMFVGNDLIEAVTINPTDLRVPGYLGKFKRSLKSKYAELIQAASKDPEFLVSERELPPPATEKVTSLPPYAVQRR
jgi:hypothetical protein